MRGAEEDKNRPIGVFDSGVGGLTVYRELSKSLPHESFVYLGDTARVPYGSKSQDVVLKYALQNCLFLLDKGVKLIVVACNTASAFALEYLKSRLRVPLVGVVEPGVKAAMDHTRNHRIGVIGTEGTIRSGIYERFLKEKNPHYQVFSRSTGLLVPLIEENVTQNNVLASILKMYLSEFIDHNIDTLILGCTHYPLLKQEIQDFFKQQVQLVDSACETARSVQQVLSQVGIGHDGVKDKSDQIFVTDAPDRVKRILTTILKDSPLDIQTTTID